jgi:REP element-mobilizing transposase RayT
MRSRYRVHEKVQAHFVTSTTVAWLPIFTIASRCDVLVQSLEYCRAEKNLKIYAWVILDNHFHAILFAPDLRRVMAGLKRHTARRLLELLTMRSQEEFFTPRRKGAKRDTLRGEIPIQTLASWRLCVRPPPV